MSKALLKYIRLSPTKARLIAREVQGLNAEIAIAKLEFTPNKAARIISKVIASAVANGGYDAEEVVVLSCRVDNGPVLRRFTPRARGRATPIRKPTAHILVEVGAKGAKLETAPLPKAKKTKPDSTTKAKSAESTKATKTAQTKAPKTESKGATKVASKTDKKLDSTKDTPKAESKATKAVATKATTKPKTATKAESKSAESKPKATKTASKATPKAKADSKPSAKKA